MVIFDIRERIFEFIQKLFELIKVLPDNRINRILINQIVRSGTSIGANYEEADGTPTKKDFAYKMSLVKKEAKETKYWLKLIRLNNDNTYNVKIAELEDSNETLIKIISKIIINSVI